MPQLHRAISIVLFLAIIVSNVSIAQAQVRKASPKDFNDDVPRGPAVAAHISDVRSTTLQDLFASQFEIGAAESQRVLAWFDANNAAVAAAIDETYRTEAGKRLAEYMKDEKAPATTTPAKRRAALSPTENVLFQNAAYRPDDKVRVTTIETDDGIVSSAATEKTTNVGQVEIKHGAAGNARVIAVEGGILGTETKTVEYTESSDPVRRTKVRTELTMNSRVVVTSCPDANGIVAGTGKITSTLVTTITTRETIAILRREVTTLLTIKGYVNDAAVLTHYDMKGTAMQAVSGYDRAVRLGLGETASYKDGTQAIDYSISGNKIGTQVDNEYGFPKTVGREMGEVKATYSPDMIPAEDVPRLNRLGSIHVAMIHTDAEMYLVAAQSNWRNYGCVELKMTAAKTRLRPAEQVSVTTETVHKFDGSKVNANLEASGTASVTPAQVQAEPQVTHTLTAPGKGSKAQLIVKSVSRRGMALEILDFEEEKPTKPQPPKKGLPVKTCNGAWSGKITAVRTKRSEVAKPADGRLVRQIENAEETFSIDYNVLGIADTSQGFSNAYFSDAQMNYRAVQYRESNYAPGKMSCKGSGIITTPQTQKIESLMTALSSKRITVFITSVGEHGILTFDSPEVEAERIITRTYESSCPSYNQVNSGVDRSDSLIGVPSPGFEITFELDAKSDRVLKGSKRIENSDGSYTIVTWDLARGCQ